MLTSVYDNTDPDASMYIVDVKTIEKLINLNVNENMIPLSFHRFLIIRRTAHYINIIQSIIPQFETLMCYA